MMYHKACDHSVKLGVVIVARFAVGEKTVCSLRYEIAVDLKVQRTVIRLETDICLFPATFHLAPANLSHLLVRELFHLLFHCARCDCRSETRGYGISRRNCAIILLFLLKGRIGNSKKQAEQTESMIIYIFCALFSYITFAGRTITLSAF